MRITPAVPPALSPQVASTAAVTDTARSFSDLLQAPAELRAERKERAFAYDEVGLLAAPVGKTRQTAPVSAPADLVAVAHSLDPAMMNPTREGSMDRAPTAAGPPAGDLKVTSSSMVSAVLAIASATTVSGGVSAPFSSRPVSGPDPAEVFVSRTAPRRMPDARPAKGLSLSVAEKNGALQVVAAAGGLEPVDRARLRRAIEAVAAQFGLSIADFTLEGSSEPEGPSTIGVIHGDYRG